MVGFRGSTQEKSPSEIFRFGYGKAANDKMVPDPVGSGIIFRAVKNSSTNCFLVRKRRLITSSDTFTYLRQAE
jgi:hypothetical protein